MARPGPMEGSPNRLTGVVLVTLLVWLMIIGVVFAIVTWWIKNHHDSITFTPSTTQNEKAVLIDGVKEGTFQDDWSPGIVSPATSSVDIGKFTTTSSPNSGEVVAFSPGMAPFIKTQIPWSDWWDTVDVTFHGTYNIEVKIWLLTGYTFNIKQVIEHDHCRLARDIWLSEGHGVRISCSIADARTEQLKVNHRTVQAQAVFLSHAFDCDSDASLLKASGAYTPKVLNVYYVNAVTTVLGQGDHYGIHCNTTEPDIIALGVNSVEGLLAHEIGHALIGNGDEDHIDELSPDSPCSDMPLTPCTPPIPATAGNTESHFDRTNVMHGASDWRATLTEGQVFRAFFNSGSALNKASIYGLGLNSGLGTRICGGVGSGTYKPPDPDPQCPQLQKRLWPDEGGEYGTWPSN